MAHGDWAPLAPEIRIAQLLLQRTGLRPPVPVHDLLRERADVERVAIPGSVDALVIRRVRVTRPRVILNALRLNMNRERFTVAHELGHLILPWQTETVFCHTEETLTTNDDVYRAIESEANRFAGELLVPVEWALSLLSLQARFTGRSGLERVVKHPKFQEFLAAKSSELAYRRRRRERARQ